MSPVLATAMIVVGAYLLAGIYYVAQRLWRDPAHPGALDRRRMGRIALVMLTWLPACILASARYARAGWRPALAYFVADAGAPTALFAAILVVVLVSG